jgi:hypothetical protein
MPGHFTTFCRIGDETVHKQAFLVFQSRDPAERDHPIFIDLSRSPGFRWESLRARHASEA